MIHLILNITKSKFALCIFYFVHMKGLAARLTDKDKQGGKTGQAV